MTLFCFISLWQDKYEYVILYIACDMMYVYARKVCMCICSSPYILCMCDDESVIWRLGRPFTLNELLCMWPWFVRLWWRHKMETFPALLAICAGNSPVTGEFPARRPMARSFDIFVDLRLNKRLRNNREADDLRRHRALYDVIVMCAPIARGFDLPFVYATIYSLYLWLSNSMDRTNVHVCWNIFIYIHT